ncbi:hypothetical protein DN604_07340 [Aeromonas caviae]|nr:hypothetical protein DN604_07340 [Aeromonas caviae]
MTQHMLSDIALAWRHIKASEHYAKRQIDGLNATGEIAVAIVVIVATPVTFRLDIYPSLKQLLNEAVCRGWVPRRLGGHERPVRFVCTWPGPLFIIKHRPFSL